MDIAPKEFSRFKQVRIIACGTSWHSALIGEMMMEELARIPTETEYASEFRYRNPIVTPRTLCIVISQSGETADTLAALREPVDAFFDKVMVNAEDARLRGNRLALLGGLHRLMNRVADLSKLAA